MNMLRASIARDARMSQLPLVRDLLSYDMKYSRSPNMGNPVKQACRFSRLDFEYLN